jgi:INO80 complex subunit C
VRKNAKQILTLERERVSGGDGFLSALQVEQKARGEPYDGKKKAGGGTGAKRGANLANLHKGRNKGRASGVSTPAETEAAASGATTPVKEDSAEEEEHKPKAGEVRQVVVGPPRKEVFTCKPTAGTLRLGRLTPQTIHRPPRPRSCRPRSTAISLACTRRILTRALSCGTRVWSYGMSCGIWYVLLHPCLACRSSVQGPGADQAYLALRGAQTSLK